MEAEIGVTLVQAIEQPKPPEPGRDNEWNFSWSPCGNGDPANILIYGSSLQNAKNNFCCFKQCVCALFGMAALGNQYRSVASSF